VAFVPSKILTAVGKSLTRRAAFRAAMQTDGEGTRSYANALFKFRCCVISQIGSNVMQERESIPEAQRHLEPARIPSHI